MRVKRLGFAIAAICWGLLTGSPVLATPTSAQEAKFWIDFAEPDLGRSLSALSRQTGAVILYPYQLTQVRGVRPVIGTYSVSEALDLLLKGTGFSGGLSPQGVITISVDHSGCSKKRETMLRNSKSAVSVIALLLGSVSASTCAAQAQERAAADASTGMVESVTVSSSRI